MFDRDNDDDGENDDDDNNVDDDGDNGENLCWFQAPRYQGLPYLLNSTFIHQYLAFNVSLSDDNLSLFMTEIYQALYCHPWQRRRQPEQLYDC